MCPQGLAADVSDMAAAADLHGDPQFGVSPELVLVDAALSAEVRRLLVVPEDAQGSESGTPQPAAPAPELADLILTKHEASVGAVIEHMPADDDAQDQHAGNTYPTLPTDSQEDATDAVLRPITTSA